MRVENFIKKLKESESYRKFAEELQEASVTGNVAGYDTPNAFAASEKEFEDRVEDSIETYGYTMVPKQKRRHSIAKESTYKQAMSALTEVSYKSYKTDETKSTNQKINSSIKEINRAIYEIERVVNHASKLKTEMNVDQRSLWGSSHNRLRKIGERLNRISKKINELGA